jgi:penicillin amidase
LRRGLRFTGIGLIIVVVLLAVSSTLLLRGSLPRLSGEVPVAGLSARVQVTRDNLGVVDIAAASRRDVASALGYVHAQDRFFQMDLQRRAAAGELASLFGSAALSSDRDTRRHRFRWRAEQLLDTLGEEQRGVLEAYSAGVNRGLDDLRVRPFEYLLLRQKPLRWKPEDSFLTLYAMFLDLSLVTARSDAARGAVHDAFPAGLAEYLLPRANRWEAPLQGDSPPLPVIPDSTVIDMRDWTYAGKSYEEFRLEQHHDSAGSNSWAVAGDLTQHGGAIVANDMHLGHAIPNIWYRARMSWGEHSVVGVTLPGTPSLIAGSNGHVAWGFTNSYGDWVDLVVLEGDSTGYESPEGRLAYEIVEEVIEVAGSSPDTLRIDDTIWGPVWTYDEGRPRYALRWTAHDAEASNLDLLRLETARNVDEAVAIAATAGIPPQNFLCGDDQGRIAWTVAGRIPRREGWDGRLPASWADGSHGWKGYRDPADQPRIVDPEEGRLWSANNRAVGGKDLEILGDGDYALGARARQIRDGLRALDRPSEADMLALQLDDRALWLGEWRTFVLEVLDRHVAELDSSQAAFHTRIRDHWEGHAEVGSVSYRLMRSLVSLCVGLAYEPFEKVWLTGNRDAGLWWLPHPQAIAWQLLSEKPAHLLPPWYDDWDALVLRAVQLTMEDVPVPLDEYTWGAANVLSIRHPFTQLVPALSRWLAAPAQPMPGDSKMPRVQGTSSGASERLIVSPGREAEGIFHMPGGQSGHPLSRYFLAGHEDWVEGRASRLLPGAPQHRLDLVPER